MAEKKPSAPISCSVDRNLYLARKLVNFLFAASSDASHPRQRKASAACNAREAYTASTEQATHANQANHATQAHQAKQARQAHPTKQA